MSNWYRRIYADMSAIPECIDFFESELATARKELDMKGKRLEFISAQLPGLVEHRFGQLQEIEAILEYLNIQYRKIKTERFKRYLEKYQRELSSRDADKYAEGDPSVVDMAILVNEFALLRNKFLGISKALDQKAWMIGHITRLRCAGLDDANLD